MGKSRMMGAGNASATLYNCDPNIPTGGGNKKQGITSRVDQIIGQIVKFKHNQMVQKDLNYFLQIN